MAACGTNAEVYEFSAKRSCAGYAYWVMRAWRGWGSQIGWAKACPERSRGEQVAHRLTAIIGTLSAGRTVNIDIHPCSRCACGAAGKVPFLYIYHYIITKRLPLACMLRTHDSGAAPFRCSWHRKWSWIRKMH